MQSFKTTSLKKECPCIAQLQREIREFTADFVRKRVFFIRETQVKRIVKHVLCATRECVNGIPKPYTLNDSIPAEKEKIREYVIANLRGLMQSTASEESDLSPSKSSSGGFDIELDRLDLINSAFTVVVTHLPHCPMNPIKPKPLHVDFMNLDISCSSSKKLKHNTQEEYSIEKYVPLKDRLKAANLKHKRILKYSASPSEKPSRIPKLIARRKLKLPEPLKSPEVALLSPGCASKQFNFSMDLPPGGSPTTSYSSMFGDFANENRENKLRAEKKVTFSLEGGEQMEDDSESVNFDDSLEEAAGGNDPEKDEDVIDDLLGALLSIEEKRIEERLKFEAEVVEIQGRMDKLLNFIRK